MAYKQNDWTEESLLALTNEDDRFEKKSGKIFPADYKAILAKIASAFANSSGGYIVVGMCDEKEKAKNGGKDFDGVNHKPKQISFDEWLEDQVAGLLSPPIQNYRVLPVQPKSEDSQISPEKPVFVIEIEASEIAPHQSSVDKVYYYREGNDSKPATHYYLEGLRSVRRFVSPQLVRAWLDSFLTDLLKHFEKAAEYYEKRDFIPGLNDELIRNQFQTEIKSEYMGTLKLHLMKSNAKQFLRRYPRFDAEFKKYAELNEKLNLNLDDLRSAIAASHQLESFVFDDFIMSETFATCLRQIGIMDIGHYPQNRQDKLSEFSGLFPSAPRDQLLSVLANVISLEIFSLTSIQSGTLLSGPNSSIGNFIRIWYSISDKIAAILSEDKKVSQAREVCENTLTDVKSLTGKIVLDLDNEIDLLTMRSGVSYN